MIKESLIPQLMYYNGFTIIGPNQASHPKLQLTKWFSSFQMFYLIFIILNLCQNVMNCWIKNVMKGVSLDRERRLAWARYIYQPFSVYFELRLFNDISRILIETKEGSDRLFKYFVYFRYVYVEIEKNQRWR